MPLPDLLPSRLVRKLGRPRMEIEDERILNRFADQGIKVRLGISGRSLTTFSIGGPLEFLVEPNTEEEVAFVISALCTAGREYRTIGAGSNLLISDRGVRGWVIKLGKGFRGYQQLGQGRFFVGASTALMSLSRELSDSGYAGLEFAGGIPASVGGAVRMNAGAHGGEMVEVLESVRVVLKGGVLETLPIAALDCSYRSTSLPDAAIVIGATVNLIQSTKEQTSKLRASFLASRKSAQPLSLPSAGSIFKNPTPEQTAGRLIEATGLKGTVSGGAKVSEMHGNWIVNEGKKASHSDVVRLIEICTKGVKDSFNLTLESELLRWI